MTFWCLLLLLLLLVVVVVLSSSSSLLVQLLLLLLLLFHCFIVPHCSFMFCVLWALLPDSNKWMDGWMDKGKYSRPLIHDQQRA